MPSHLHKVSQYEAIFDEADEDLDDFISLEDLKKLCNKYKYNAPPGQIMVRTKTEKKKKNVEIVTRKN